MFIIQDFISFGTWSIGCVRACVYTRARVREKERTHAYIFSY